MCVFVIVFVCTGVLCVCDSKRSSTDAVNVISFNFLQDATLFVSNVLLRGEAILVEFESESRIFKNRVGNVLTHSSLIVWDDFGDLY